jgi:hypothetical protein
MKILRNLVLGLALLIAAPAYAVWGDLRIECRDGFDADWVYQSYNVPSTTTPSLLGNTGTNECSGAKFYLGNGLVVTNQGSGNYNIAVSDGHTVDTELLAIEELLTTLINGKVSSSTHSADMNYLQTQINGLVIGESGLLAEIAANLYGTSSTMTIDNASTTNGFMTKAQKTKLDSLADIALTGSYDDLVDKPTRIFATSTRSIETGTGATGFQLSDTRDTIVNYAVSITTTASIGGASAGYVTLEMAPTNSTSSSAWYEVGARCRNDQTITLAVALQSVQNVGCTLNAVIPAGYYAKIRSVNVSGTPSYTYISGQEVQL